MNPVRQFAHFMPPWLNVIHVIGLHKDLTGSIAQIFPVIFCQGIIVSFHEVMVECSVGVFWGANCHNGKVKFIYRVRRDCCGKWGLLPFMVGFADKQPSNDETTTNCQCPSTLCNFGLKIVKTFKLFCS